MEAPEDLTRHDTVAHRVEYTIKRKLLNAADLREEVEKVPQLINTCDLVGVANAACGGDCGACDTVTTEQHAEHVQRVTQSKL